MACKTDLLNGLRLPLLFLPLLKQQHKEGEGEEEVSQIPKHHAGDVVATRNEHAEHTDDGRATDDARARAGETLQAAAHASDSAAQVQQVQHDPRLHYRLLALCPVPTDPVGQSWPPGHRVSRRGASSGPQGQCMYAYIFLRGTDQQRAGIMACLARANGRGVDAVDTVLLYGFMLMPSCLMLIL